MADKKHILIIDDDPMMQRIMGAKLAKAGYEVMYSQDPAAGREMARRFMPDLILLDIRMPGETGFSVAKLLHEEERTKNIPVIFLTNEDLSFEGEQWAREKWVVDYIHKSIDPNEFLKKVQKYVPGGDSASGEEKLVMPK